MVELKLDMVFVWEQMSEEEKRQGEMAATILQLICKDDAKDVINGVVNEDNGYEMWRYLCRAKLVKSANARLQSLLNPTLPSLDPRVNLRWWRKEAIEYVFRTGEPVTDTMRRNDYIEKIAPSEMKQHLLMAASRVKTCEQIADEIEDYCGMF